MSGIPSKCPHCGSKKQWKEEVNAVTSGIPIGNLGRVRLLSIRGLFARPAKEVLDFYKVNYRCYKCGFRKEYQLPR